MSEIDYMSNELPPLMSPRVFWEHCIRSGCLNLRCLWSGTDLCFVHAVEALGEPEMMSRYNLSHPLLSPFPVKSGGMMWVHNPERDRVKAIYCDGGVVGKNPSDEAGTWAWVGVDTDTDTVVVGDSGYTTLRTNNQTELLAVIEGLEWTSIGWRGTVFSDSQNALGRVFSGWARANVPPWLQERLDQVLDKVDLDLVDHQLLQGHPTVQDLFDGVGKKRGLPVSKYNVMCDEECNRLAKRWKDGTVPDDMKTMLNSHRVVYSRD